MPPTTVHNLAARHWTVVHTGCSSLSFSLVTWFELSSPFSLYEHKPLDVDCPLAHHADSSVATVTPSGRNTYWPERFHYITGRESGRFLLNPFGSDQSIMIDISHITSLCRSRTDRTAAVYEFYEVWPRIKLQFLVPINQM